MEPLPMFEQFLAESDTKFVVGEQELKGIKITDDTKFTGEEGSQTPVQEPEWIIAGEYTMGKFDGSFVRLIGDSTYWVTRYDYEGSDIAVPLKDTIWFDGRE